MVFYPPPRPVPHLLVDEQFIARPLTAADAEIDYAAYMASPDTIRAHSGGRWPIEDFTLAENRQLAAQHEEDHLERRSFTYLLLDPEQPRSLGCLYLLPLLPFLQRVGADEFAAKITQSTAMATFWLRQEYDSSDLADAVVRALVGWLRETWLFDGAFLRVNALEERSISAIEFAALKLYREVELRQPPIRYRFYQAQRF